MKQHFPSFRESLELVILVLMVALIQLWIDSWMWSAFFVLGFIWNWSVLNGWVGTQVTKRQYRFSMLKGITKFHELLTKPVLKFPRLKFLVEILPAGLMMGLIALILNSAVPWWAAFLGSFAFILVRRQIAELIKLA